MTNQQTHPTHEEPPNEKGNICLEKAEAEIRHAEHDLERAERELKEAEAHCPHKIEVTVDRKSVFVEAGNYLVSAFKALVGVAADRELDLLKNCALHPLDDNAQIFVREHEAFVSHARCGGSS